MWKPSYTELVISNHPSIGLDLFGDKNAVRQGLFDKIYIKNSEHTDSDDLPGSTRSAVSQVDFDSINWKD